MQKAKKRKPKIVLQQQDVMDAEMKMPKHKKIQKINIIMGEELTLKP